MQEILNRCALTGELSSLAAFLAVYLVVSGLQRALRGVPLLRQVAVPLNMLALCFTASRLLAGWLGRLHPATPKALALATVFLALYLAMRLADILWFERILPRRNGRPAPVVIRDIGRWLVSAALLAFLVKTFFPEVNLNVLAVSSLVVGYIVGNATQDTLGNLVAGLALHSERPFAIGDWITAAGATGRVVDINWRATLLRTKTDDYVVIPNAAMAREPIVNLSRPTEVHGHRFTIGASYDAAPGHVTHVLLEALRDTAEVEKDPAPQVRLIDYADFSIVYEIKFFLRDYARLETVRASIMSLIWYRFRREGIAIPFPIRDVRARQVTREDDLAAARHQEARTAELLGGVDIFSSLAAAEIAQLARLAAETTYAAGEILVRQGAEGSSLFVIRSGRASVTAGDAAGRHARLAELGPGAFFGEMSLLTGEKRTATVAAETDVTVLGLSKEAMATVLEANPRLAEELALALQRRAADRAEKLAAAGPAAQAAPAVRDFASRIRRFFGIREPGAGPGRQGAA